MGAAIARAVVFVRRDLFAISAGRCTGRRRVQSGAVNICLWSSTRTVAGLARHKETNGHDDNP